MHQDDNEEEIVGRCDLERIFDLSTTTVEVLARPRARGPAEPALLASYLILDGVSQAAARVALLALNIPYFS